MNKQTIPIDVSTNYSVRFHSLGLQMTTILDQVSLSEVRTRVL